MIPESYMPLNVAAKRLGISTRTMKKRLESICGLVFRLNRYERPLVAERDVQTVIDRCSGVRRWHGRKAS